MPKPYNIIKQLSFDIQVKGVSHVQALGEAVADFCQRKLMTQIEQELSQYAEGDRMTIEKLELDLGSCSSGEWQRYLQTQLRTVLHERLPVKPIAAMTSADFEKTKKPQDVVEEALIFFLQTGQLPWWYPLDKLGRLEKAFKSELSPQKANRLLYEFSRQPKNLARFINTFSERFLTDCAHLAGVPKSILATKEAFLTFLADLLPMLPGPDHRLQFWNILIEFNTTIGFSKPVSLQHFVLFSLQVMARDFNIDSRVWHRAKRVLEAAFVSFVEGSNLLFSKEVTVLLESLSKQELGEANITEKKDTYEKQEKLKTTTKSMDQAQTESQASQNKKQIKDLANRRQLGNATEEKQTKEGGSTDIIRVSEIPGHNLPKIDPQKGVFVQHAGLVLLHPFLPRFFDNIGLTKDGQWKDETSNQVAVQVLAHLATGQDYSPEYELLLIKHLCGLPWETLIELQSNIPDMTKKAANELLEAVIEHWSVLKSTSTLGLRQSFFDRSGKLWKEEGSWHLQVEQKGQDILLRQLPWGLGTIRLPWLEELIWVTWT